MRVEGHIELDWSLEAIQVGARIRRELGDIQALMDSIREKGFLQPITISPDGVLILGWRRYEAARRLGMRTVNVWVRPGLSDRLQLLLAEQDDETLRKALTPTESATLYRETKQVMAEDAARRQEASRFGGTSVDDGDSGAANLAAPGDARAQAAQLVTGSNSYTTLERVSEVQRIAEDEELPGSLRQVAVEALAGMDEAGKVNGYYQRVKDAVEAYRQADISRLAEEALARVTQSQREASRQSRADGGRDRPVRQRSVREFVLMWVELDGWTAHYDPAVVGPALSAEQWQRFESVASETATFAQAVRLARNGEAVAS